MTIMKIGEKGSLLIKHYEGIHDGDLTRIGLQPKMCPSGIWTVGWGHAIVHNRKFLKGKENYELACELYKDMTLAQADKLFLVDIQVFENQINAKRLPLLQHQFDAVTSHTYNTGGSDTLFKLIRLKASEASILKWFQERYIMGDGKVLKGLIARRKTEALLYQTGELKFFN